MIIRLFLATLLLFSSFNLTADQLGQLTAAQLETMQEEKPLIIDLRTTAEHKETGIIPNSHPLQSFDEKGQFDEKKWIANLKKLHTDKNQPIVLICRSGNRSSLVGQLLVEKLEMKNIHHLSKGLGEWIKSGHKVVKNCQPKTEDC